MKDKTMIGGRIYRSVVRRLDNHLVTIAWLVACSAVLLLVLVAR